jgi:peptidoglycan/LPS O-acetylase OafA/YrhL
LFVRATSGGWAGVNLFFILSGFLITGVLLETKNRPDYYRRFYWNRILRIVPAYCSVLLLLALLGRFATPGHQVSSWQFLGLSAVYLSNMTPLFRVAMQFPVLWSLSVEEHFYMAWPLLTRNLSRRGLAVVAIVIAIMSITWHLANFFRGHDFFAQYTWLWQTDCPWAHFWRS